MKNRGFSLIELVIVILFLGILSVIAVLAVSSIYKEGAKASQEKARNMIILMIEDYLVEDFAPADCIDLGAGIYSCPLTVLENNGYIKDSVCNKADNKKIDLNNTKFKVKYNNTNDEYNCEDCVGATPFVIENASAACSDIQLEGGQ